MGRTGRDAPLRENAGREGRKCGEIRSSLRTSYPLLGRSFGSSELRKERRRRPAPSVGNDDDNSDSRRKWQRNERTADRPLATDRRGEGESEKEREREKEWEGETSERDFLAKRLSEKTRERVEAQNPRTGEAGDLTELYPYWNAHWRSKRHPRETASSG